MDANGLENSISQFETILEKEGWLDYVFGIILFGSYADKKADLESDIDLVFLAENKIAPVPKPLENTGNFRRYFSKYPFNLKLHLFCYTLKEFQYLARVKNPLLLNILAKGKAIRGKGRDNNLQQTTLYLDRIRGSQ